VAGEGIKNESSVWTKYEGEVDRAGNPKIFVINLNNQQVQNTQLLIMLKSQWIIFV